MEILYNALSALFGTIVGGIIAYRSSIVLFRNQQTYEAKMKYKEIKFTKNKTLYKLLGEYEDQLNKCFYDALKIEEFNFEYYSKEGARLRKLLDKINYLAIFTNIPEVTYQNYQKDLFSFWRVYSKYIGDNKIEEIMRLDSPKIPKEELISNRALEGSIIREMKRLIEIEIKKYIKDLCET